MADDGRPYCAHGPMLRNGHKRDGRQVWGCPVNIHARSREHYERHGLRIVMRQQLRDHAKRLAELRHQTEGD